MFTIVCKYTFKSTFHVYICIYISKYTFSDMHYSLVETVPDALDAAVQLAEYHSISVLWEGFDVNRYGKLTWIICGYL